MSRPLKLLPKTSPEGLEVIKPCKRLAGTFARKAQKGCKELLLRPIPAGPVVTRPSTLLWWVPHQGHGNLLKVLEKSAAMRGSKF